MLIWLTWTRFEPVLQSPLLKEFFSNYYYISLNNGVYPSSWGFTSVSGKSFSIYEIVCVSCISHSWLVYLEPERESFSRGSKQTDYVKYKRRERLRACQKICQKETSASRVNGARSFPPKIHVWNLKSKLHPIHWLEVTCLNFTRPCVLTLLASNWKLNC